jgi:general secretion pathway protein G
MKPRDAHGQVGDTATRPCHAGFTLVEILIVVGLIGTLAAIATPVYLKAIEKARSTRAIGDIKNTSLTLGALQAQSGSLPDSLAEIGMASLLDPWGRPYQYMKLEGVKGKGKARKDKYLVPLNSDFDLYSMGPDGQSVGPLTAKASRDDIVRANNGGFIGLASDY